MRPRSALVALGALAGVLALVRRRSARARVDVFYEDGSMMSLEPSLPQAERMLGAARHALAVTRTAA